MIDESNIPVLTDLIEKDAEIELSDLGLDQVFAPSDAIPEPRSNPAAKITMTPALEQEIRRILDEHLELAWQEIRLAIQRPATGTDSESES
jgi:hypothetical protein